MRRLGRLVARMLRELRTDSTGRGSVVANGAWGTLQQGVNLAAQALLSFLLIIHMSVEDFGVYSYAIVMASLGVNFMSAGLSGLAIKVLVPDDATSARLVSSILVIRESMAVVAYLILGAVSLTSGSGVIVAATLISMLVLFARAGDAPEFWYKAKMRTRVPAVARVATCVTLLLVRVALLLFVTTDPFVFVGLYVLEALIAAVWIIARYRRENGTAGYSRPRGPETRDLLRKSFPLFLSGLAHQVNLRGDVIFIQALLGTPAVAVYSAAARIAELAYFLPNVFMNASLPGLVELHDRVGANSSEFRRVMQRSYDRAFWVGLLVAGVTGAVGTALIGLFFGPEYRAAIPMMWISLIACPFMFMAAVYSKWILTTGVLWSSTLRNTFGAAVNVALNLVLLPTIGLIGAPIATAVSYVAAAYLACFIGRRTRIAGIQMTRAILAPLRWLRPSKDVE